MKPRKGQTHTGRGSKLPAPQKEREDGDPLPVLGPREAKFVADYVIYFNGSRAVRQAGYDTVAPGEYARQLLNKPEIRAHVEAAIKEIGTLHFKLHDENTARLIAMRDADRTDLYDADGNVKDPREWPEALKFLLAGIEVEEQMKGEGDEAFLVRTKKVKLVDPKGIIDSLAKITGQWIERSQFLDRNGKPTDPPSAVPVLVISVGDKLPEAK